jgi:hypothetical protein
MNMIIRSNMISSAVMSRCLQRGGSPSETGARPMGFSDSSRGLKIIEDSVAALEEEEEPYEVEDWFNFEVFRGDVSCNSFLAFPLKVEYSLCTCAHESSAGVPGRGVSATRDIRRKLNDWLSSTAVAFFCTTGDPRRCYISLVKSGARLEADPYIPKGILLRQCPSLSR